MAKKVDKLVEKDPRPIWFVKFPVWRYNEDVKVLARKGGFRVVDAKFQDGREQCKDAPKLTVKEEYALDELKASFDPQEAIARIGSLKADELKLLAAAAGVTYTNVDETRAAIKAKYNVE